MRISDWSSDVCSSDLPRKLYRRLRTPVAIDHEATGQDRRNGVFSQSQHELADFDQITLLSTKVSHMMAQIAIVDDHPIFLDGMAQFLTSHGHDILFCARRSEEHTSELQSLLRISYADYCLTKK